MPSLIGFGAGGALSGVGSAIGAVGSIVSTLGAMQQARAQAAMARANAEIQERNARLASEQGMEEAYLQDRKNRLALAEQLAEAGTAGTAIGSPSFLRARESFVKMAGEESAAIATSYQRQGYNMRQQAAMYRTQAKQYKRAAAWSMLSGAVNTFATVMAQPSLVGSRMRPRVRAWNAPRVRI